jgi:hypothetical protein
MKRALVLLLALLPAGARADQVVTRGGGPLDGEIVERGADLIVVDVGGGTIGLPLSYVERIVPGPSPIARYRARAERLAADDAAGWLALAEWARRQDLRSQAGEALLHVVSRDPGNVAAHQALGHVKVGEQWMTTEESARARGLVSHEGRWMTPGERETLIAEREAAAEQGRAEAEALASLRESEARARVAEAQARLAEAEARTSEERADRVESAGVGVAWLPVGPGSFVSTRFHRGVRSACPARARSTARHMGMVHVPGRGGAFVVSGDPRPLVRP